MEARPKNTPALKVYSSSAGSGKTFTLAKEYIKLMIINDSFTSILAVTFTNDAAYEMKSRIMSQLKELISENSNSFKSLIASELSEISPELIQKRAKKLFSQLLHQYSNFSVLTIDGFFQKIVNSFTTELDLPFYYEIQTKTEDLIQEATDRIIDQMGNPDHEELTETFRHFSTYFIQENSSWKALENNFIEAGNHVFQEENLDDLTYQDYFKIYKNCENYCHQIEDQIIKIAKKAQSYLENSDYNSAQNFYQVSKGIFSYFKRWIENFNFSKCPAKTFVLRELNSPTPPSLNNNKDPNFGVFFTLFLSYAQQIETLVALEWGKISVLLAVKKHIFSQMLVQVLREEVKKIEQEESQFHISSFSKQIQSIIQNEPIPFIYERIGEKYHHYLIDEFQDTSATQWHNFLPLVENALSHFSKNPLVLLVGDAKQAIYRWRGGKMQQIMHLYHKEVQPLYENEADIFLKERYESIKIFLQSESLQTNYRSSEPIIGFINDFFEGLLHHPELCSTYPLLSKVYTTFKQTKSEKTPPFASISITFQAERDLEALLKKIHSCQEEGYSYNQMAILVRTNKEAQLLADFLYQNHIQVFSKGSLLVQNAQTVRLIMAVFKLISDPTHLLSLYEVLHLLSQLFEEDFPTSFFDSFSTEKENKAELLQKYWSSRGIFWLKDWNYKPLYTVAEEIISQFKIANFTHEESHIFSFLEIVHDFSQKNPHKNSIDFIDFWEKNSPRFFISQSNTSEAVFLSTIHAAKGLQYPIVILPFADWSLVPDSHAKIWVELPQYKELESEPNRFLSKGFLSYQEDLPPLAEQMRLFKEEYFMESLNTLYVALTRAETQLHIFAKQPSKKRESIQTVYELLELYLTHKNSFTLTQKSYEIIRNIPENNTPNEENNTPNEEIILFNPIFGSSINQIPLRFLTHEEDDFSRAAWGTIIHETMEKIHSPKDIIPALTIAYELGKITEEQKEYLHTKIQNLLHHKWIAPLFSGTLKSLTERDILINTGKTYRPDRLFIIDNQAIIVDYKTGKQQEKDQIQLKNYIKIIEQTQQYKVVKGYLIYFEEERIFQF